MIQSEEVKDGLFSKWREDYNTAAITEGYIEPLKYILAPQEVKPYAQAGRESYSSFKRHTRNFCRESMKIYRNGTSIANSNHEFLTGYIVDTKPMCFIYRKYTEARSRIDIGHRFFPSQWSFEFQRDNGKRMLAVQGNIGKGQRAHWKSSRLGMGSPVSFAPGCFLIASSSRTTGSCPIKTSPLATMAYFPTCLSTNSPRWRRIHSALLILLDFFLGLVIMFTSITMISSCFIIPQITRFVKQNCGFFGFFYFSLRLTTQVQPRSTLKRS